MIKRGTCHQDDSPKKAKKTTALKPADRINLQLFWRCVVPLLFQCGLCSQPIIGEHVSLHSRVTPSRVIDFPPHCTGRSSSCADYSLATSSLVSLSTSLNLNISPSGQNHNVDGVGNHGSVEWSPKATHQSCPPLGVGCQFVGLATSNQMNMNRPTPRTTVLSSSISP